MYTYDTLSEAVNDLKKRGYTEDFGLRQDCIECAKQGLYLHPEDFMIDEFYRFEGNSNPDDSSVVYAISSKQGLKGVLIDAYGIYSEYMTEELVKKLKLLH